MTTACQGRDRSGLAARYRVLPETGMNLNPAGKPRADRPDMVVVGTGSTRLFRAEVTISHEAARTVLHVIPGGISAPVRLTNRLWIARQVQRALEAAPTLR